MCKYDIILDNIKGLIKSCSKATIYIVDDCDFYEYFKLKYPSANVLQCSHEAIDGVNPIRADKGEQLLFITGEGETILRVNCGG